MIYFQGTDNTLWTMNPDGTGGSKVAGYQCKSRPIAYGNYLYFQGTDDKLWQVTLDGATGTVVGGGNKTTSAPFITATGVYFQGTDDKLWRIGLDGTGQVNLGGYATKSTPFIIAQFVFFQGTDNKLWRSFIDGTGGINLGNFQTKSSPFATTRHVYFQGTDDKLWRANLDGTDGVNLGGYKTSSTPFVADQYVYFQGTDNKLWRINLDGSGGVNLAGFKCNSSPTVDSAQSHLYFRGTDNALWRTDLDGGNGTHLGGFNTASTPFVVQPNNQPQTGSMVLPYAVLLLAYAPPGSNNGKNDCQVEYASGSSAGTTVSIAGSFKVSLGITAGIGFGTPGKSGGMPPDSTGFGVTYEDTTSDTSTLDIKKTQTNDLKVPGPASDGIDHNKDRIYILLRPTMNVIIDPQYNMNWGLGFESGSGGVVYLQMDWLKDPNLFATVEPDVKKRCDAAGMTASDYAHLLALNPFANGPAPIDRNRYLLTDISLSYQPPGTPNDPVPTGSETLQNAVTYTASHSEQTSWGLNVLGGLGVPDLLNLALKATGTFTWTTTTTTTNTSATGFTQTAAVTVGGPAFGYGGPTDLLVYWDTMFNVFMFAFPDAQPTLTGVFRDNAGKAAPHVRVQLTVGSQKFFATTDATGTYRFYHTPQGAVQVTLAPQPVVGPVDHIGLGSAERLELS